MILDIWAVIGIGAALLAAVTIIVKDGFTISRLRQEKDELRRKIAETSATRIEEVQDEADRHHACEIEAAELKAKLKAANLLKDGWRSAAEKGRGGK